MERCTATIKRTGERCRLPAAPGDHLCPRHRRRSDAQGRATRKEGLPAGGDRGDGAATVALDGGPYEDLFDDEDRAALARALDAGLSHEAALLRVLIRRAVSEGRPSAQVAQLAGTLARLLRTQAGLGRQHVRDLDEALAAALDAIAREIGFNL